MLYCMVKDDVETIKSEVEAMHPQLTLAPLGVVSHPTPTPIQAPVLSSQDPSNLTFTIQYNMPPAQPAGTLQTLQPRAMSEPLYDDEDDEEDEEEEEDYDPPGVQLGMQGTSSNRTSSPRPLLKASDIKPILPPVDPDKA